MKKILLFSLLFGTVAPVMAQDIFGYDAKTINGDNLGVFAGLSFNTTGPMIQRLDGYSHTAKGAVSTVPSIGVYYQKGIGDRLSFRFGFAVGYANYAYKYAQSYDSLSDNFTPLLSSKYSKYTKVKHGSGFAMPQADLGYIFGPFKKVYLLEVRGGIGLHAYLKQAGDTVIMATGTVTDTKGKYIYPYKSTERSEYGQPQVFGSVVANFYAGMRWQKTFSDFLNHFSLGIQVTLPVSTNNVGFSEIEYKNTGDEVFTRERVNLSLCTFGFKAAYSFL